MQSAYAAQYEDLWRNHWWWQSRKQFVLNRIQSLHAARPFHNVVDVGCGNGLFFDDLLGLQPRPEVSGIEPDGSLVSDGPQRARIEVRPFDDSFRPRQGADLLLMLDVLEHIEQDVAAARHACSILAPGGVFLLTVPALQSLWSEHDVANRHFRRYSRSTLRRTLLEAGFRIESLQYFFGWTIAPMLLRRVVAPARPAPSDAAYHVTVPPTPVNAAMYGLSRAEQFAFGRTGLPVGSSLIAVARKPG